MTTRARNSFADRCSIHRAVVDEKPNAFGGSLRTGSRVIFSSVACKGFILNETSIDSQFISGERLDWQFEFGREIEVERDDEIRVISGVRQGARVRVDSIENHRTLQVVFGREIK